MTTFRDAAVQFAAGDSVDGNLKTVPGMTDRARAAAHPDLLVLPEFESLLVVSGPGPSLRSSIRSVRDVLVYYGVIFETPRGLAPRRAQVLGNSLNSFALDEASLHVPVRARKLPSSVAAPGPGITGVDFLRAKAHNRMVTRKTEVVASRPYWLVSALVTLSP